MTIKYRIYLTVCGEDVQIEDIDIPSAFDIKQKSVDGWPVVTFKMHDTDEAGQRELGPAEERIQ